MHCNRKSLSSDVCCGQRSKISFSREFSVVSYAGAPFDKVLVGRNHIVNAIDGFDPHGINPYFHRAELFMADDEDKVHYLQVGGLEVTHMPDGWVIYKAETDRVHFLNPTAALVFELCNGRHTISEMEVILSAAYEMSAPATDQVRACISNLLDEGLVTPCS